MSVDWLNGTSILAVVKADRISTIAAASIESDFQVIYTLQYLRALAAIMVVCSHLHFKSALVGADVFAGFRIGAAGVDIFFVISGFVMAMIYMRTPDEPGSAGDFWLRRLARIIPMYWLVSSAALMLYLVNPSWVNANSGPTSIWRSYTLIPTWHESNVQFLIGPGWSLSFELFFYLLCTALFFIPLRSVGIKVLAFVLVVLALGTVSGVAPTYLLTSPLLLEFAFGMVIHAWYLRAHGRLPVGIGMVLLIAGVAGFTALNCQGEFVLAQRWWRAGIPAAALVAGVLSLEVWAYSMPSRMGLLVGNASYSLYLTHVFVLGAASRVFGALHLRTHGTTVEVVFWTVTLFGAIAVGCVSYLLIEKPMTDWLARCIKQRRAAISIGASSRVTA